MSGIIQEIEKDRIGRFHFMRDAKASLIGRMMIRKLITQRLDIENTDIVLKRDERNKPTLISPTGFVLAPSLGSEEDASSENPSTEASANVGNANGNEAPEIPDTVILCDDSEEVEMRQALLKTLNFNVSHQGMFAVLASDSSCSRIGIDIMNITSPGKAAENQDHYFELMDRQFTAYEWVQIKTFYGTDEPKRMEKFTRFWTLKEAYVKAIGIGIIVNLKRLEFHTKSDLLKSGELVTDTKLKIDGEWKLEWDFEERFIDNDHIVAVAKEYPERIKAAKGKKDLAGAGDDDKTETKDSPEPSFTIPPFEVVQLDFLCSFMHLLYKPDYAWVENFLKKK